MRIIANGAPKTGTHALKKAIELLGLTDVELEHRPHPRALGTKPFVYDGKMVTIFRHPRNVLISACRANGDAIATGNLTRLIKDFVIPSGTKGPLARIYKSYFPWRDDQRYLCIRYEDLVQSDEVLREIATYLNVPFLSDAFKHLPGLTRTWTGSPSRWEDHWTSELDTVWVDSGMESVQIEAGY